MTVCTTCHGSGFIYLNDRVNFCDCQSGAVEPPAAIAAPEGLDALAADLDALDGATDAIKEVVGDAILFARHKGRRHAIVVLTIEQARLLFEILANEGEEIP